MNSNEFVSKEKLLAAGWTDRKIDVALDKAKVVLASLGAQA
jgi:DNA-binding winged helix-turn-helix (wHTH) protein